MLCETVLFSFHSTFNSVSLDSVPGLCDADKYILLLIAFNYVTVNRFTASHIVYASDSCIIVNKYIYRDSKISRNDLSRKRFALSFMMLMCMKALPLLNCRLGEVLLALSPRVLICTKIFSFTKFSSRGSIICLKLQGINVHEGFSFTELSTRGSITCLKLQGINAYLQFYWIAE